MATKEEKQRVADLITGVGDLDTEYETGMYNGLLLAQSIMTGDAPELATPPENAQTGECDAAWALRQVNEGKLVTRKVWKNNKKFYKQGADYMTSCDLRGIERVTNLDLDSAVADDWELTAT